MSGNAKDFMSVEFFANGEWATAPHDGRIIIKTETGKYRVSCEGGKLQLKSVHCAMAVYPQGSHGISVIDAHHTQWNGDK